MKKIIFLFFTIIYIGCDNEKHSILDYVNPFIGTGGHGHTYPGASTPFGMMQLSPDTRLEGWDGCSGYHYSDNYIYGFSHTHLSGTGIPDYGDVLIMPTVGDIILNNGSDGKKGYRSKFSHKNEDASPGWYHVLLENYNIDVSLTVSERAGFHKYIFPENENSQIILDLQHRDKVIKSNIEIIDSYTIRGERHSQAWAEDQRIYFYIKLSEPIIESVNQEDSLVIGCSFGKLKEPLLIKIGISSVSKENAEENLNNEIPHWNFEETLEKTQNKWKEELSKIKVKTKDEIKKEIFYTALYHSFLSPNIFCDVNGDYLGTDLKTHTSKERQYTVFSLWDTFRATHPLFTLIQREKTEEFLRTFLRQYEDGGQLPVWELAANYTGCMIGYHSIPVITDAYVKGITNFDKELALKAMIHSANKDHLGLHSYKNNGFISSSDEPESVSKTLEYSYDDWCIAEFANLIGKDSIANIFYKRAQYYKNLFDPSTNFFRAKNNYSWFSPFDPSEVNFNYTEANAWQYSMFVPQDIQGHINLMGGETKYENHLDQLFTASTMTSGREQPDITGLIGQYAHGNEPSHHMAYLYNYIGKPYKTQEKVKQILTEQYSNLPDGLSGNEDCGQMSSWYVLSSLGFYSVTPGLDYYTIGTPIFEQSELNLENGKIFKIIANNVSDRNLYIQSATLNGKIYNKSYLKQSDIMKGGEIIFEMGNLKSNWGNTEIPPSSINNNKIIPVPYFISNSQTFSEKIEIKIGCVEQESTIFFTTDGSAPNESSNMYISPIVITENTNLKAICKKDIYKSKVVSSKFYKIDNNKCISLKSKYANQYAAAGDKTLIDQLRGGGNYRTGNWQGYRENLSAIVDLGNITTVSSIGLGCLQDIKSWIFFPLEVNIYTSENGEKFDYLTTLYNSFPDNKEGSFTQDFIYETNLETRYIQITAQQYGFCPEWHLGAGGKTWIFVDEIIIE